MSFDFNVINQVRELNRANQILKALKDEISDHKHDIENFYVLHNDNEENKEKLEAYKRWLIELESVEKLAQELVEFFSIK